MGAPFQYKKATPQAINSYQLNRQYIVNGKVFPRIRKQRYKNTKKRKCSQKIKEQKLNQC